jgi:hypothetical protein
MFHPSPSDQKSGFVSSKNFYASFTTTSIPIPQGLALSPYAMKNILAFDLFVAPFCRHAIMMF